jgi:hypothetical protein
VKRNILGGGGEWFLSPFQSLVRTISPANARRPKAEAAHKVAAGSRPPFPARNLSLLTVALATLGCRGGQQDLMPLDVGKSWTYHVISGLDSRVESVKAVRPVAVDGVEGMELNGPLGISRLAWRQNSLIAESTSNLRFHPGLPLLAANGSHSKWVGQVTWMGRDIPATADTIQRLKSLPLNSRVIESTESEVVLHLPSRAITLTTWFEPGVGIVRQEQHTGVKLDIGLELIEGP